MGADERAEASSVLGQGFAASLVSSLAVMALNYLHGSHPESVRHHRPHHADGREYLGIVMIGFVFQITSMAVGNSLRSQNRPRTVMISTISGTILNASSPPFFIFAFHWGIAGAAWATVIAQTLGAVLTFYFIQDRKSVLKIEARALVPQGQDDPRVLNSASPSP